MMTKAQTVTVGILAAFAALLVFAAIVWLYWRMLAGQVVAEASAVVGEGSP